MADPTELIVTGAPVDCTVFVDGAQAGDTTALIAGPRVLRVAPGPHTVEVRMGDPVVYREQVDVARGEKRVVTVLSGSSR